MDTELLVKFTNQKIVAFRNQISVLKASTFPHNQGLQALEALEALFTDHSETLDQAIATGNKNLVFGACATINSSVYRLLPLLGFILRSTNVRNSFEYYSALLDLSRKLVGAEAKLILSSEWFFSPMTYPLNIEELPEFVLIGLPASEAGNALIIPLAGHEIGHSIWHYHNLEKGLKAEITAELVKEFLKHEADLVKFVPMHKDVELLQNLFFADFVGVSLEYLLSQCEEMFCDFVGLMTFGEGYLYSFLYLLGPNIGGVRSAGYPLLQTRASYLASCANELDFEIPPKFVESFAQDDLKRTPLDDFLLKMADLSAGVLTSHIKQVAKERVHQAKIVLPTAKERIAALRRLSEGIPVERAGCIADIINAGWRRRLEKEVDESADARETLNDLVLKSIEVLEYRQKSTKPWSATPKR